MNLRWLVIAGFGIVGVSMIAALPADAGVRHKTPAACADRPTPFSWEKFFFNGRPRPNGCAPAVFEGGEYVGQDPDPNVRAQLRRNPNSGYTDNSRCFLKMRPAHDPEKGQPVFGSDHAQQKA